MRIIIVTAHYSPSVYPHAFRWSAIAEHWANCGHEVAVIAGGEPGASTCEVLSGVQVSRVGNALSEPLRRQYARPSSNSGEPRTEWPRFHNRAATALRWIHERTWKPIYWPDSYCLWYPAALRAAWMNSRGSVDVVITTSIPFTSHLVGLAVKKWRPRATWILDIADPFSLDGQFPQNNTRIYSRLNRAADAAVFKRANHVAVTCEETAEAYRRIFPEHSTKLSIIPHLAIPHRPTFQPYPKERAGALKLVFVGTLDGAVRDPSGLFLLISELRRTGCEIELHVYGRVQNCDSQIARHQALVGSGIVLHGVVQRDRAWQAMCGADVLVNIANSVPYQLPSKLVDYVAAGKPILNVAGRESDPSAQALRGCPSVLTALCSPSHVSPEQTATVSAFLQAREVGPEVDRERWLARFELPAIVRAYEELIGSSSRPAVSSIGAERQIGA